MGSIAAGVQLGPYEIEGAIGVGGMGEVYRARDGRLGRTVAIKILPELLGRDPSRRERFEREARAIAALNHPHICAIYDVGREGDTSYLVLEHLEGETLSARLKRTGTGSGSSPSGGIASGRVAGDESRTGRGIPLVQALRWGIEIADALAAAHRQGIVHRDLKPANVMLTRAGVKLLDFGLAKLDAAAPEPSAISQATAPLGTEAPTKASLTGGAKMVGTLPYMAPEQLEGRPIDARCDIFALGLVLYEMIAGRRAFEGRSEAGLIAAILEHDPPSFTELAVQAPPALKRLVHECLAKNPDDRWQSASDVRRELATIFETLGAGDQPAPSTRRRGSRLIGAGALIAVIAAGVMGWLAGRSSHTGPGRTREVHFQIVVPDLIEASDSQPRVSPDGRRLVIVTSVGGLRQLQIRPLDAKVMVPIPGSEGAMDPFWSPDGKHLAFVAHGKLKRVELDDGAIRIVTPIEGRFGGGTWNLQGTILFAAGGSLSTVAAAGGSAAPVGALGIATPGVLRVEPQFLPDGRRFVYFELPPERADRGLRLSSLDDPGRVRALCSSDTGATVGPDSFLLYGEGCALKARRFDLEAGAAAGETFTLVDQIRCDGLSGRRVHSVSRDGTLVYRARSDRAIQLTWFDRSGKRLGAFGGPGGYRNFDLSPDGRQVITVQRDRSNATASIFLLDERRSEPSVISAGGDADLTDPIWAQDGLSFAYAVVGPAAKVMRHTLAPKEVVTLLQPERGVLFPEHWSRDGKTMAVVHWTEGTHDVAIVRLDDQKLIPMGHGLSNADEPQLSPDGKLLAFSAAEADRWYVFIEAVPPASGRWQVSSAGGVHPRWSQDGRTLYFLAPDGTLNETAVRVRPDGTPDASPARALFTSGLRPHPFLDQFAVSADGSKFLLALPAEDDKGSGIEIVLGWTSRFAAAPPSR